jgi:hypothetical protein
MSWIVLHYRLSIAMVFPLALTMFVIVMQVMEVIVRVVFSNDLLVALSLFFLMVVFTIGYTMVITKSLLWLRAKNKMLRLRRRQYV